MGVCEPRRGWVSAFWGWGGGLLLGGFGCAGSACAWCGAVVAPGCCPLRGGPGPGPVLLVALGRRGRARHICVDAHRLVGGLGGDMRIAGSLLRPGAVESRSLLARPPGEDLARPPLDRKAFP